MSPLPLVLHLSLFTSLIRSLSGALKFLTLIRDPGIREKAQDMMKKCRLKLGKTDDEASASENLLLNKNFPKLLFDPNVNVLNAFVVPSMTSPRFDVEDSPKKPGSGRRTGTEDSNEKGTSPLTSSPSPLSSSSP